MTLPDIDLTPGQWRLAEVQLANWGTFDGAIYRLPVARRGHLLTGPSGSGKSSLLDAVAAVLTPDKWLRLNQAAQGAGVRADQRTLVSYVRGAWSRTVDDVEDRVVSQFLRPGATWSGILLRFENELDHPITVARLFYLRAGGSTTSDINDLCLLERSVLDLRDLESLASAGIEARRAQTTWPDAVVTSNRVHARFYARLRGLFGIADETALQLLHKTQSAKNLDSLDELFREYMLEEPQTFALADNAVEQFGELRDAHDRVVQLRLQRDHLIGLRAAAAAHDGAVAEADRARDLAAAVAEYQQRRGLALAGEEVEALDERLVGLEDAAARADARYRSADDVLGRAERAALELGGAEAEHLQREIGNAREQGAATEERWQTMARQLGSAGIDAAPRSAGDFAELMRAIDELLKETGPAEPTYQQHQELFKSRSERDRLAREIDSVRATGSTVPGRLLRIRAALTDHLGLPVTGLPFAAELLEVVPEHREWTGAIERVLRSISLALLVRTEHLAKVRRWVELHDLDGSRLVFEEVRDDAPPPRPAGSADSLVHRVTVAAGPFAQWLGGQLSERFDYTCVRSPDQLDQHRRAVTINGQVKTSRTRYEKDDRTRIDDRGVWVLGDREAKIEALVQQLKQADEIFKRAEEVVEALEEQKRRAAERLGVLRGVRELKWSSVDVQTATARTSELERQLDDLTRDDSDLAQAVAAAETARQGREYARAVLAAAGLELSQARRDRADLLQAISGLETALRGRLDLPEDVSAELDQRFRALRRHLDRAAVAALGQPVTQALRDESDVAGRRAQHAAETIVRLATAFNEQWPAAAAAVDLSPSVDDRHGYLEMLDQILANGLPEHEASFLRLLRERSRDMIGELVSDILAAPQEIKERIVPVNESLRRSPFDAGLFLHLRVKQRHSETVRRFIADLRSVAGGSWTDDDLDSAERRFAVLAEIMAKLGSSVPADRTWRRQCLDTRQHVTFLAEEVDEDGRAHATYDSGAAMSGGQQQKLVVFCLAAALRYQLADADDLYPRYGTIVLDEAFDKADTRYTRMALNIFVEFGFQLVLATPQKLLQTIEPYVGAATSIENPTRRRSQVSSVRWDVATGADAP